MKEFLLAILIIILKLVIISVPVMYLLNWVLPSIFALTYLKTVGLLGALTLIRICCFGSNNSK